MSQTMKKVLVEQFGGIEQLKLVDQPLPQPGPGQVRVKLTSIGMNHADLMARRGEYRIASGDPPFTPGLEGGGVIEAVGPQVGDRAVGQRVILSPDAPRLAASGGEKSGLGGGTYRTHYLCPAAQTMLAPPAIPDDQLGALWLPYLTAWGCLVWKQNLKPGQIVALPAASSSVALAAAQIARALGAKTIGLTTSPQKRDTIMALPSCAFDQIITTRESDGADRPWYKDLKAATDGRGVDVFFDPVAAGAYLDSEIRCLAPHGTVWVYGLLGKPGVVNVTPLIRLHAAIRGWAVAEIVAAGPQAFAPACRAILDGFADGRFKQELGGRYPLAEVGRAHEEMERGRHIGKLVLIP
ncbi:MAG: zinc-binding dehydrogenase [Phycisphaeraceae bacterium]|nr:zinc-binding dehydrogenase [Phycisphaeraceae bacterium]